ncbi:GntR family transcriptional regulator [Paenibacillus sp. GCM10023252]|uniref:GntR family transcriptional regulator n=1 Tax=Paenibacillus sp. GCM10023252 TaxID=3252649 RepID=UPI00360991BD
MTQREKQTPMYTQIHHYIIDGIEAGTWKPEEKLPSENELASQFSVSRITIKKALDKLVEEDRIYRIQGKGSFVAKNGRPILYASDKQRGKKPIVSLLLPRVDNRFTSNLLKGIERTLDQAGCRLLLSSTYEDAAREKLRMQEAVELGVSGIIVYPVDGESYNEDILRLTLDRYPIVIIDRYLKGIETNCVCSNHEQGAYEGVKHLLDLGHSQIAFASSKLTGTTSLEDRLSGYERALSDCGLPVDRRLLLDELHEDDIRSYLHRNTQVTAVFASNYGIGMRIIQIALAMGKRVPEDLSVVCFDDDTYSFMNQVPPTCVVQQEEEIGAKAAELLLGLMDNPDAERKMVKLPTSLVVRKSSGSASRVPN